MLTMPSLFDFVESEEETAEKVKEKQNKSLESAEKKGKSEITQNEKSSRLPPKIQEDRKKLAEQVVADIRSGKPFFWDPGHYGKPNRNLVDDIHGKNTQYHGINALILSVAAKKYNFKDTRWATFKQVQSLQKKGVPFKDQPHVKKGAKGIPVEFWRYTAPVMQVNPKTGKKEPVMELDPETGQQKMLLRKLHPPMVRRYTVFNAEQIENIPPAHEITINEKDRNQAMESMLKNSEAEILYDQRDANFYNTKEDKIHLMGREDFKDLENFYSTAAHEIAHSTGAENRLNRPGVTEMHGFGSPEYAKEELRAEMASLFIAQQYGIVPDPRHYENHVAYLQSWAEIIQKDPDELFRAASDAEKAVQYIQSHMIEKDLTKEQKQALEQEKNSSLILETPEDRLLKEMSVTITYSEGNIEKNPQTQATEFVLGGGMRSFPGLTPGEQISSVLSNKECAQELGGHIYQEGKEYKGAEANQLLNDLIKDDITSSIRACGYNKTGLTVKFGDKEDSFRIDIGDGNNFDISNGQNGYITLINTLQEEAPRSPLLDRLSEVDTKKLAEKTQEFPLPSFQENTLTKDNGKVYFLLQRANQALEESYFDQLRVLEPQPDESPEEHRKRLKNIFKELKKGNSSDYELVEKLGFKNIRDNHFEYTPKMMKYYVQTLKAEKADVRHYLYIRKIFQADMLSKTHPKAFSEDVKKGIQDAANELRAVTNDSRLGVYVKRQVTIENNLKQLIKNTRINKGRLKELQQEREVSPANRKVETKKHGIRRTIEIPDKKRKKGRRYLPKKKTEKKSQEINI